MECGSALELLQLIEPGAYPDLGPDGQLQCTTCREIYPIIGGTVRALSRIERSELHSQYGRAAAALAGVPTLDEVDGRVGDIQRRTVEGFAYEWETFGGLRDEWHHNFRGYMQPFADDWFKGKLILDVGGGSGRHSYHASAIGAQVITVDLGRAIDVARRNLPASVLTVQADIQRLPFEAGRFDMVASIGVLPVLPDPERSFRGLVRFARPGGHVHIYVYWIPRQRWHQRTLAGVTAARRFTVRLPHRVLHALCIPLAAILYGAFILPFRFARSRPALARFAEALPLKAYADYPFGVCVNDQFDRLSAPIENRHTADEVASWFKSAGLESIVVLPNHGWVGDGTRPVTDGDVARHEPAADHAEYQPAG